MTVIRNASVSVGRVSCPSRSATLDALLGHSDVCLTDVLAELCIEDPVRINRNIRAGDLYGEHGVIVDLDHHAATVRLLRPVGRFRSGEPPLALDELDQPTWPPAT